MTYAPPVPYRRRLLVRGLGYGAPPRTPLWTGTFRIEHEVWRNPACEPDIEAFREYLRPPHRL